MKGLESLDEIFTGRFFRIPDYQHGFSWGPSSLLNSGKT